MEDKELLFDFDKLNKGFKEMKIQYEMRCNENNGGEKIGSLFDFKSLADAFNVMERQSLMQNYDGKFVDVVGSFIKLGYDKKHKDYIHALIQVLSINNENIGSDIHIWIRDAALLSKDVWTNFRNGDVMELRGKIYPYISSGDKKYSIKIFI